MRWTRKKITDEIRRMKSAGEELNYSSIERGHLNLARAAAWHFGNWRGAVEAAGIDYEAVGKYQRWSRERVVARILALHAEGADLSWRAVSTRVDPPLAAAALRANGFANWREAIAAAGLKIEDVARYRRWDDEGVIAAIKELHRTGGSLASKAVQSRNQPLFCAARRRFGSWDSALKNAGVESQKRRARTGEKPVLSPREVSKKTVADSARVLAARTKAKNEATTKKATIPKAGVRLILKKSAASEGKTASAKSTMTHKEAPGNKKASATSRVAATMESDTVATTRSGKNAAKTKNSAKSAVKIGVRKAR